MRGIGALLLACALAHAEDFKPPSAEQINAAIDKGVAWSEVPRN